MTSLTNKIYSESVSMSPKTRDYLLACFDNHLDIYNDMVDYYFEFENATYKEMKTALDTVITDGGYKEIVRTALCNEIYYLHKKADMIYKNDADTQYISGIGNMNYKGRTFVYDEAALTLKINAAEKEGVDMILYLPQVLPTIEEGYGVYTNLSYSTSEDVFRISVFKSRELSAKEIN